MKVYAISSRRPKGGSVGYRNLWPYREFFHGGDSPAVIIRYGERPYKSLHLVRNVRLMPPVFFPTIYMVVSEEIVKHLNGFRHVDFAPCVWEKVYDYPVDEEHVIKLYEELSHMNEDFNKWLDERLRLPGPGLDAIKYSAVIVPLLKNVASDLDCTVEFELPPRLGDEMPVRTSPELHDHYPILRFGSYYLCAEPVYRVLQPYVSDPAMFGRYCVDFAVSDSGRPKVQVVEGDSGTIREPLVDTADALGGPALPPPDDASDPILAELLQHARAIGGQLAKHPTTIRYQEARIAVSGDPEAHQLWVTYSQMVEKLGHQDSAGIPWSRQQKAEFKALVNRVSSRASVKQLDLAEAEFYLLLRQITDEIEEKAVVAPCSSAASPPASTTPPTA